VPSDLDGNSGRLISLPDRKKYCNFINEAVSNGARQKLACELVGLSARTYQRWNKGEELSEDKRIYNNSPTHNRISDAIRQEILSVTNQPAYSTLTPYKIVPALLDLGQYLASESTFYRIMREHNQLKHRGKNTANQRKKPQQLKAENPN
jgi:putative transposase